MFPLQDDERFPAELWSLVVFAEMVERCQEEWGRGNCTRLCLWKASLVPATSADGRYLEAVRKLTEVCWLGGWVAGVSSYSVLLACAQACSFTKGLGRDSASSMLCR